MRSSKADFDIVLLPTTYTLAYRLGEPAATLTLVHLRLAGGPNVACEKERKVSRWQCQAARWRFQSGLLPLRTALSVRGSVCHVRSASRCSLCRPARADPLLFHCIACLCPVGSSSIGLDLAACNLVDESSLRHSEDERSGVCPGGRNPSGIFATGWPPICRSGTTALQVSSRSPE
jgi:hypothetical protein